MSAVHMGKILTGTIGRMQLYQTVLISLINIAYS